ncbi:MAG: aldo/keto reductase [Synergistaceae bacterium]|nr:aldo/keto reductase [Synergistaceae bacterium]
MIKIFLLLAMIICSVSNAEAVEVEVKNENVITLNSGYVMPVLGLGTWTLDDQAAESAVYIAIKTGYRLIDTARYYGNEIGVGKGVRRAIAEGIVKREEIFVTSKVMPGNFNRPDEAIDDSNNSLGLGYIDLMLIHQSGANDRAVYKALERAVKDGKVRSIGISNYYTQSEFERITAGAEIMPAVIQNENHIYYNNSELQSYVKQFGTVIESYYPFGGRGHTRDVLGNPVIKNIAQAHAKTPAQIILRWHVQSGYIAIPGSSNPEHIAENFNIFNFKLSASEMQQIAALNKNRRYESW